MPRAFVRRCAAHPHLAAGTGLVGLACRTFGIKEGGLGAELRAGDDVALQREGRRALGRRTVQ